jgi:hypothetical protein
MHSGRSCQSEPDEGVVKQEGKEECEMKERIKERKENCSDERRKIE